MSWGGVLLNESVYATEASIDLTVSSTILSNVIPHDLDGTVTVSDTTSPSISIKTDNSTGYMLSIQSDSATAPALTGTNGNISSITTATSSADNFTNGTYGYKPTKKNNENWDNLAIGSNTSGYFLPAPTNSGDILDTTNTANATENEYNLAIATKIGGETAVGSYSKSFMVMAVANPVTYKISYSPNGGVNAPSTQSDVTSANSITLQNGTPTRDGYSFAGWCTDATSQTSCSGTLYQAGATFPIDQVYISNNFITLSAIWTVNTKHTVTMNITSGYGSVDMEIPQGVAITTNGDKLTINDITFTATPQADTAQYDYAFINWTNTCGATMPNTNCAVTANFTRSLRSYTVTWNGNGGSTPTATTKNYGEQIGTLPTPTYTGYDFLGWFTAADGGTQISETTTVTGNVTYWAHWEKANPFDAAFAGKEKLNGYYKMQDMSASICNAIPTPTTTTEDISTQLIDTRDNKIYWVSKLKDGNCWMTQNLDYDVKSSGNEVAVVGGTTTTWNSSYPAHATETTLSSHTSNTDTYSWDPGDYYVVDGGKNVSTACTTWRPTSDCQSTKATVSLTSAAAKDNTNLHYHLGNYYQWNTATAGYGGTNTDTDISYSICPKGWRLPTSNSYTNNYSFGKLTNAYGITNSANGSSDANLIKSPLWFVRAGNVVGGSLRNQGTLGYVWSSRAYSTSSRAYRLYFLSSNVNPSNYDDRYYGYSVRCVAE